MSDSSFSHGSVLDRVQRLQQLSRGLPLEPRAGLTTLSQPNHALFESPDAGALTTPLEQSAAAPAKAPRVVGNYTIESILGKGGMGWVFKAHDNRLNRTVALKMLLGSPALDERIAQRFAVESQALARLEHPNIVPVYEASEWEGVPYFAMKYVRGGTLAENAERLRGDLHSAVRVMAKVAHAVGYLHGQSVSHRDLKPANILLGEEDEPLVADFGLAKFHDADSDMTVTGCLLGTRYYMSPEQTRGETANLSPACDTWSVGVILYELIRGKLPFDSEDYDSLFQKIRESDPPPLTTATGEPLPELDAVIRHCLAKDPTKRYPSATALAEDLERWLAGEKVQAPAPQQHRGRRWAIIGLAACAVAAVLIAAMWKPATGDPPNNSQVLIGKAGMPVNGDPIAETHPVEALGPRDVYTLASDDVALVDLGEHSFANGTVIEANVQQLSCGDATFSFAGVYCCGKLFASPNGRILHAVAVRLDTVETGRLPPANPLRPGYGSVDVGRWNPSEANPWNLKPHGSQLAIGRDRLVGDAAGSLYALRIEISPDQTVASFVNNAPLQVLTPVARNACFESATSHDRQLPVPAEARFGQGVGLVVQSCRAAFWNITVRPLSP
jgi:hypothetical protein